MYASLESINMHLPSVSHTIPIPVSLGPRILYRAINVSSRFGRFLDLKSPPPLSPENTQFLENVILAPAYRGDRHV